MIDTIENILINNFQKNIEIEIDDKTIKKGKFILYKIASVTNYFHIELYLERPTNHDKIDTVKLPLPFECEIYSEEGLVFFDYRAKALFKDSQHCNTFNALLSTSSTEPQKFFNKIVVIKFT